MCELLGMSSNLAATLSLSLTTLAAHGGLWAPHKDGWGVGYYEGADVRLIKGPEAAGESEWIRFIEEHELRSRIVIAHVRKATIGERSYRNAQPFTRELAGRVHLFAHNGYLPGIDASPRLELEQRLNFGYGCYGCREATDIGPNETVLGFPVTLLPPIFEHLEFLNEKAIPASRSKRALAALEQREKMPS